MTGIPRELGSDVMCVVNFLKPLILGFGIATVERVVQGSS